MSTTVATAPTTTRVSQEDSTKPSVREKQLEQELATARTRIAELEKKVASLEAAAANKKRKTSPTAASSSSVPLSGKKLKTAHPVTPASTTTAAVGEKQKKLICKRLQQTIKNSLKGVKFYSGWDSTDRKINVNDVLSIEEFNAVFGNHGVLVQPTPTNKPNSTVYVKVLDSDALREAIGNVNFKGELWTKGGQATYGGFFFGGRGKSGFTKSNKISGGCQVYISNAEAKFSSNNGNLLLKCTFSNPQFFNDCDSDDGDY